MSSNLDLYMYFKSVILTLGFWCAMYSKSNSGVVLWSHPKCFSSIGVGEER